MKTPKANRRAPGAKRSSSRGRSEPSHVVGIGGSAGSLEPLERFFRSLRPDSAMSFLVVTHRDPRSKGMMAEILARFTKMKVCEAKQGARLERGVTYVVPSDRHLDLRDGRIELLDRPTDVRARTPIDSLFRAIANDRRERGVGVVFSGMGADGTIGLAAIKENLGVALVQDPLSAAYDAMPRSAISAELADFVGTPETLAETLDALASHLITSSSPPDRGVERGPSEASSTDEVLALVRGRTGHDFSQYKRSTIARRVERRLNLHRIVDIPSYLDLLVRDGTEIDRLFADLLIGVTRFFRDPEVWESLAAQALELFRHRPAERPLRVWVAGCASGEEAYSMAIVLREYWAASGRKEPLNVQLYATDLDRTAIDRARKGCYGLAIAADVSRERLTRFFVEDGGGYRVKKDIRDMVVFATQNVISDPPFTKLDILSCRNVLIYLEPQLQRKVVPLFLHALAPGGILVVGRSEAVHGFEDAFITVDTENKLFRRRASARGLEQSVEFPIAARPRGEVRPRAVVRAAQTVARAHLPDVVQREIVEHVAPPVVVVDKNGTLLFASQRTGRYFEPPAGTANLNVFAMAREGLSLPLRTAVRTALARGAKVTQRGVRVRTNGHEITIDLVVAPIRDGDYSGAVLVALVPADGAASPNRARGKNGTKQSARHDRAALVELRHTKAQVDALMDEMGHSQEALKSANEELQSANEELQSTNEELTTSKEEMQSMNEELLSLNAELQTTNEQSATTNDDMRNLLNSSQIPTLFLDNELRLKRYTAQASRIARLIAGDVGRPITDVTWSLRYETLASDVRDVLDTLVFKEAEVLADDGSIYTMRIHPYRTIDDVIDGVVITFVDITAQKRAGISTALSDRQATFDGIVGQWPGIAYVEEVSSGRSLATSAVASRRLGYSRTVLRNATEGFWSTIRLKKRQRAENGTSSRAPTDGSSVEVSLRSSDGTSEIYGETMVVLSRGVDGRATHVLHIFRRRRYSTTDTHDGEAKATKRGHPSER